MGVLSAPLLILCASMHMDLVLNNLFQLIADSTPMSLQGVPSFHQTRKWIQHNASLDGSQAYVDYQSSFICLVCRIRNRSFDCRSFLLFYWDSTYLYTLLTESEPASLHSLDTKHHLLMHVYPFPLLNYHPHWAVFVLLSLFLTVYSFWKGAILGPFWKDFVPLYFEPKSSCFALGYKSYWGSF